MVGGPPASIGSVAGTTPAAAGVSTPWQSGTVPERPGSGPCDVRENLGKAFGRNS
jgi:hypothetical protein